MTPYAVLLVKFTDTDEIIRKAYHALARLSHPDALDQKPSDRWFEITAAYTAIKTEPKREDWAKKQAMMSGFCGDCEGTGVKGTRMFKGKVRVCAVCSGEGRC